ncbi:peptide-methionine (S)-S-oxide reductase MsrA [Tenacibaculum tangerinum]|uniref:Peptide methionine sulfoxide reductase MsrA n=1 Tax=Tenacibaculum tangerinum TaxID=3038772 RepID=A0ABY8L4J7_9FLAO|nr:peptide-methionine (S)-S-oxide reductase MsrA [Tenacibaculum tangerinum]WGH76189.1 peptide-methionine (S)-S-oxide reductase MsrA [Tenacibaculum tangerinum]
MKIFKIVTAFTAIVLAIVLLSFSQKKEEKRKEKSVQTSSETKVAYFASGCFWCVEAIFESVYGVEEAVSGYAGGHTKNPTYETIGTGSTGHAESVAVYYNPKKVSFQTLVTVFFGSHDPTTKNGQHPDYGSQYRSIAFYENQEEKEIIENTIIKLNKEVYDGRIVTEVMRMDTFYPAEEYHQNYERLHPENPYVRSVSIPRLHKFKRKFPKLLKKEEE